MERSIKGIVRRFINELNELLDEPLNKESIDKLGSRIDEFELKTKSTALYMRTIMSYLYAKLDYPKAIQELNKFIED